MLMPYCKAQKFDEAIKMFNKMEVKNINLTPHIYCTLFVREVRSSRIKHLFTWLMLYPEKEAWHKTLKQSLVMHNIQVENLDIPISTSL